MRAPGAETRRIAGMLWAAGLWILLVAGPAGAAALTGAVDRSVLPLGETFDYVLSLTGGDGREPPDVSALSRDFDIVMRRRDSRAEVVDGKRVDINEWVITLAPRRTGTLTVPALSLAGATTQPVQVQVVPPAPAPPPTEEAIFVRVDVGDVAPFVQSDIPISIRIYDRLGMRQGSVDKPAAEGATFQPAGNQRSYTRTIGRHQYRVIEQSYLMRPQRSGRIEIAPVTLEAKVPGFAGSSAGSDMGSLLGRGGFPNPWLGGMDSGRSVTMRSNPVTVAVQPRPEGVTGWFLPARAVALSETWSAPPARARVGEVLTRTLRLEARGASPNQLPPLSAPAVEGVREYEESSQSEGALLEGEAGAVLVKTLSVIPTRPGPVTLPAIAVPWWNTRTNREEVARLPAVTLDVAPSPTATSAAPPPPALRGGGPAASDAAEPSGRPPAVVFDWAAYLAPLRVLAIPRGGIVALVVIAIFALVLLRRRRPRVRRAGTGSGPVDPGPRNLSTLLAACARNDAAAAHRAFLAWERESGRGAPVPSPELAAAVAALRHHLYGDGGAAWSGRALRSAVRREVKARRRAAAARSRGGRLAPLYPGSPARRT